jgi:poly(3-hydroxybutyrate) depolymerase
MSVSKLALLGCVVVLHASAAKFVELRGVACQNPPPEHCGATNCPGGLVTEEGTAVEARTGRRFFLDYPCDLKRGEKVTFILSLHGAGSYGNWQRHYFPLMDYAREYRLVIATPNSPTHIWSAMDDEYLQNIVTEITGQLGAKNIKAFWLVGHSQGGMTSNRLVRTDFFKQRVDGWLSLSGGRLGPTPPLPESFFAGAGRATPARGGRGIPGAPQGLPDGKFSFIFETGQHELGDVAIPAESPWAERLGCQARVRLTDVSDTKAGYVYDSTRQNPGSDAWGHLPRGGAAEVYEYPKCKDGRVVSDVVRIGKGHTEGLEPQITERLVRLMLKK